MCVQEPCVYLLSAASVVIRNKNCVNSYLPTNEISYFRMDIWMLRGVGTFSAERGAAQRGVGIRRGIQAGGCAVHTGRGKGCLDHWSTSHLDTVSFSSHYAALYQLDPCHAGAMRHYVSYTIRLWIFCPGLFCWGLSVTIMLRPPPAILFVTIRPA